MTSEVVDHSYKPGNLCAGCLHHKACHVPHVVTGTDGKEVILQCCSACFKLCEEDDFVRPMESSTMIVDMTSKTLIPKPMNGKVE